MRCCGLVNGNMTFQALSPPKVPKKVTCTALQSIIPINQRGTALLCTHLNQDVFAFLINLSTSIWEAFSYNQWKSAGRPKYLHRLYLTRSFSQQLMGGVTGTGIHPWEKKGCKNVHKQMCPPHTSAHKLLVPSAETQDLHGHMWPSYTCNARMMPELQLDFPIQMKKK